MATREQVAWAAGLFEGGGCFTISTTTSARANGKVGRTKQIHSKIAMVDKEPIKRFRSIIGVGTIIHVKPFNPKHSWQWQWHVGTLEGVRYVYLLLGSHLCKRRRERAEKLLKMMERYKSKPFMKRGIIS